MTSRLPHLPQDVIGADNVGVVILATVKLDVARVQDASQEVVQVDDLGFRKADRRNAWMCVRVCMCVCVRVERGGGKGEMHTMAGKR